jgi:hypothetical protein
VKRRDRPRNCSRDGGSFQAFIRVTTRKAKQKSGLVADNKSRAMKVVKDDPRFAQFLPSRSFNCQPCGVALTDYGDDDEGETS